MKQPGYYWAYMNEYARVSWEIVLVHFDGERLSTCGSSETFAVSDWTFGEQLAEPGDL
jgi:hypothetical protein